MKRMTLVRYSIGLVVLALSAGCGDDAQPDASTSRTTSASAPDPVAFTSATSSADGPVYEVLPGPAALNPEMSPTPFSNNTATTDGAFSLTVADPTAGDSADSEDAVTDVNIEFTANDGTNLLVDQIDAIHKPDGAGDHTFFGGVGRNKVMHGNTGIGTPLEPKVLAYITLWGKADIKDADTGDVIAADRLIHIMATTNVRDDNRELITATDEDKTNHNFRHVQTHIIIPPKNTDGQPDPVAGTDHGFVHMMFGDVELGGGERDWTKVYEILPGPAAIDSSKDPTPFSNRIAPGAGKYDLSVTDATDGDSADSKDKVDQFSLTYQRPNGTTFEVDNIQLIHKPDGAGDHTFFGGVGFNQTIHGNTGVGTPLEPKLEAYIALWGKADLKDGQGNVLAEDRLIHIMTTSNVRNDNLELGTDTDTDQTDHDPGRAQTHIMIPPKDTDGNADPVAGTGHGFLHLMFEGVELSDIE